MAENESFFRKVVRFVANPATDWTELNSRQDDNRDLELEKSELKAMIERKRRNDFVRKREFDMLRRVRREGLSPEHLAALGGSSRLDDSEARLPDASTGRPDSGVKAKIDEIEQQMVGDGFNTTAAAVGPGGPIRSRPGSFGAGAGGARAPTSPGPAHGRPLAPTAGLQGLGPLPGMAGTPGVPGMPEVAGFAGASALSGQSGPRPVLDDADLPALPPLPDINLAPPAAPAPVQMAAGLPPLSQAGDLGFDFPSAGTRPSRAMEMAASHGDQASARPAPEPSLAPAPAHDGADFGNPFAVEVSEAVHDPELDEAVIAFANADFTQCEDALRHLTGLGGPRAQHAETWLVLFDLYRATGQQQPFESLAVDYAQQFGWSAPQWYSLPRLVAEAQTDETLIGAAANTRGSGDVGWVCPPHLEVEAVSRLRSQTLQMPLPWVFDWGSLNRLDAEAAMQLSTLFRLWAGQALEMRWVAGERLFQVLQEAAPTGVRDADPAFWLTRLDALRLCNRADQFDEAAIDYCVTYEVSPPSWESARCKVHISDAGLATRPPSLSMVSEVSTSFLESGDGGGDGVEVAHVELSGQLVGDIGATLTRLNTQLGTAPVVSVSCARLIRVDFIAAGDLLNWVLAKRNESRAVQFYDSHRLVALFFGAMGINEHARVQVRRV